MSSAVFGQYVMYVPGYKEPEVGRMVSLTRDGKAAYVCYHEGCTAAATPLSMLRSATPEEIDAASPHLGYHRFDTHCPDYTPDVCSCCEARFKDTYEAKCWEAK